VLSIFCCGSAPAQQDTLWTKTFGGPDADGAETVIQTIDGGFVFTGYTFSGSAGYSDVLLVKTDIDGVQIWSKIFGGTGWEYGYSVCQTASDSGYIVAGYTTSSGEGSRDVYLVKTDSEGNELWTNTFGGTGLDVGMSVCETGNGSYFICGYTESSGAGEDDIFLVKADSGGNEVWTRAYGGSASERGNSIQRTSDGNFIIAGSTATYGYGNRNAWLIKIDPEGETLWTGNFGQSDDFEQGNSIALTSDGGYVIAGSCDDHSTELHDMYLIKANSDGGRVWSSKIGTTSFYDYGCSVAEVNDLGYLFVGAAKSASNRKNDIYMIKTDPDGVIEWLDTIGGSEDDWGNSIVSTSDGHYVIAGHTNSFGSGSMDAWLLKFERIESVIEGGGSPSIPLTFSLDQNYPNPFNPMTTIKFSVEEDTTTKLEIYSIRGKLVKTFTDFGTGSHSVVWDGRDDAGVEVNSGVYFYRLSSESESQLQKMLLIK